eukprot:gene19083-22816_t
MLLVGENAVEEFKFWLGASWVLHLVYFSQLFCDTRAGGHSTILTLHVLFILTFSAAAGGGVAKLLCSVLFGRFWGAGDSLQRYVFDSMWSRPGGPLSYWLQSTLVMYRPLCIAASLVALAFETLFPLVLVAPGLGPWFAAAGVCMHLGIWALQGLDFVSYWCPIFLLFLLPYHCATASEAPLLAGLALGSPAAMVPALYTLVQVVVAAVMLDCKVELLPWSCCPMFCLTSNIYDSWPKWWCITGVDRPREHLEPLLYSPASNAYPLSTEELQKMPHPVVFFGAVEHIPADLARFIKPSMERPGMQYFSNFAGVVVRTGGQRCLGRVVEVTGGQRCLGRLVE